MSGRAGTRAQALGEVRASGVIVSLCVCGLAVCAAQQELAARHAEETVPRQGLLRKAKALLRQEGKAQICPQPRVWGRIEGLGGMGRGCLEGFSFRLLDSGLFPLTGWVIQSHQVLALWSRMSLKVRVLFCVCFSA